ncbi:RluA family pseudouridine synthase [Anaerosinus massiliensis]|uniref:RluA family pseudouridine synthase n=1 Tax=Massilibacillus massiliensis TaxID=1806837 RepID=UPI000A95A505|nr:RluA family pseudouridine synthase [Massilibacillus massiliensis]
MNVNSNTYKIIDEIDERIDMFLVKKLQNLSRSHIQKMIADGWIKVNQKEVKANYKLRKSDTVEFILPEAKQTEIVAEDIPLHILYEDQDVIVINKRRGMVVHPATGIYTGTLVNALLAHCKDLSGINGEIRPGIVHRLDKDTSGVMIAAKNDIAHISLAEQIKNKTAIRQYLAIVHGNIKEEQGIIDGAIGRDAKDRKKMAIVFENGKPAVTKFKVVERFGNYTLVQCKLMTGRTHQIRVHMTYIGHPLVGDPKYGGVKSSFKISGQALHSKSLTFIHPTTKQEMFFSAPLPEDMERILKNIRRIN